MLDIQLNAIPVIVIAGPTAVGKTDLSIELAQKFNGEVINGDSLQVYRELNIGTGKITAEEMNGIPHHLLDILQPNETYDVSRFVKDASAKICDIHQRNKLPIIVGGTGLYLEALLYELELGQSGSSEDVRQTIQEQMEAEGSQYMWEKLNALDPKAAEKIPFQNGRRIVRALEYIQVSGKLYSDQEGHAEQHSRFKENIIVLDRDREALYDRINQRVGLMVESGLEAEVRSLYNQANHQDWQSLKGIGYKEWFPYFEHQITKDQVIESIRQNSRRYAKRQLTWFRNRFKHKEWILINQDSNWKIQVFNIVEKHISE